MFALCVHDSWADKVISVLERSNELDYLISYAMEIYDSPCISMFYEVAVLECGKNGRPNAHKLVGYVAYSLDSRTGHKTRINPVFIMTPQYREIYNR